ncbi:hypothetical protein DXT91_16565 [Agrobacterium tumefaciens]|uniref:hypothetical protein n=1 Tax=Agrobacterium tumefaciens TaxID=358 RepID=UPI0012B8ABCD|nr:hypothetical protein [Agrobacterium tumefaciens]MQB05729.1 hypothetical protein [Agrobacterium tumefaciens]
MKEPFLYEGMTPIDVAADTVFEIVKTIIANGNEQEFRALCNEKNLFVQVSPELVNLVKLQLFSARRIHKNTFADEVIRSVKCPKDE